MGRIEEESIREKRIFIRRRVALPVQIERRKNFRERRNIDHAQANSGKTFPAYGIELEKKYFYRRIDIRDPYFALEDIVFVNPHKFTATVFPQQPLLREPGPLSAAEAGRHLAILGACAVSMLEPEIERKYYLAHLAEIERVTNQEYSPMPFKCYLEALPVRINRHYSGAQTYLRNADGETIFSMWVQYLITSEEVLLRRYKKTKRDLRAVRRDSSQLSQAEINQLLQMRDNPFKNKIIYNPVIARDNFLELRMGVIPEALCKGHFPGLPALPKAVLMQALSDAAGDLLGRYLKRENLSYTVKKASIRSESLGFAGDDVNLRAELIHCEGDSYIFHCLGIKNQTTIIGDMWLTLNI